MASIYEKTPFFKVKRTWDEKMKLPETYKLRSNVYSQKQIADVHTDGRHFFSVEQVKWNDYLHTFTKKFYAVDYIPVST